MTPISRDCPVLPKDLIVEILLRSPVKTLLRFKSICKAWQSIITSSSFQYQHYGQESNSAHLIVCWTGNLVHQEDEEDYPDFEPVGALSIFPGGILENNPISLREGLYEGVVVHHVCGPSNGILCVSYSNSTYALWNPATRKLWPIPEHPSVRSACESLFSFWIDPLTNEFKIFYIIPEIEEIARRPFNFITYSSNNDSWTQIDPPVHHDEYVDLYYCRYTVTNGFLYFRKYNYTTCNHTIIGYDISNEIFQEIRMPQVGIHSQLAVVVDLYGDSLALFISKKDEKLEMGYTEIWVMRGCWIKLFDVSIHNFFSSLGFWKGNEFFISRITSDMMSTELVIVDPLFDKTSKIEFEKVDGAEESATVPICYKESLISVGH